MNTRLFSNIVSIAFLLFICINVFGQEHRTEEKNHDERNKISEKDLVAINKVIDALEHGYEINDLESVMDTFADNAVLLEGRGINNGKNAIRDDHLAREFKSMTFPIFKSKDRVIRGSGTIAYVYEIITVQIKRNSSDEKNPASDRRAVYVLEKQRDNSWKIVLWRI